MKDISDIYIKGIKDPLFKENVLETNTYIDTVISKIYMILMTNKGDVLGETNFGGDLTLLLHETRLSSESIEGNLRAQIADYIPEIDGIDYELSVEFFDDPDRFQEYMVINFTIKDYSVYASVL